MGDKKITFNVTSNNQSGGITAGQVIVGRPGRQLEESHRRDLARVLRKERFTVVRAIMGDAEAFQFAQQILAFLQEEGYSNPGVVTYLMGHAIGQQIQTDENGQIEILIGHRLDQ
jgi:hypothetical protein